MKRGQETRERLLAQIAREPGIHKSELKRRLGYGWGTVTYHLETLLRSGQVRAMSAGRQVRLFPSSVPQDSARWLSALREEGAPEVLARLARKPGSLDELAGSLDLPRRMIRRHLTDLEEQGLIVPSARSGKFRLQDTESFLDIVAHR